MYNFLNSSNMEENKNMEESTRNVLRVTLEFTDLKGGKEVTRKIAKLTLDATGVEEITSAMQGAVLGIYDGLMKNPVGEAVESSDPE